MSNYLLDASALGGFILFAFSGWTTIVLTLLMIGYYFFHQWVQGVQYVSNERLDGKTVIVTGGASGIGKEVARVLSSKGARVVIGCRDVKKGHKVVDNIRAITHGQVVLLPLDLSSLKSVREFAEKILSSEKHGVHILVNNAGAYSSNYTNTVDGNEATFQVNYLGHFLLVNLLMPLLKASAPARIINMVSKQGSNVSDGFENVNSEKEFQPKKSYEKSKMANALFTKELAKRLKGSGVSVYGVNPGSTNTQIMKLFTPSLPGHAQTIADILYGISSKTPESGAQTTLYCALNGDLKNKSGVLFSECKEDKSKPTEKEQESLWFLSEKLLNLDPNSSPSSPIKILDINDTPLPPLPPDATPENEESPSFPPGGEKFAEMTLEQAQAKPYSSPAFDDAPSSPRKDKIDDILDNYENIGKNTNPMDSFVVEEESKMTMTSAPQSFVVEEEEILLSRSSAISEAMPSGVEDIKASNKEFDILDNFKNPNNAKEEVIVEEEHLVMEKNIENLSPSVKDPMFQGHQAVLNELSDFDAQELQKAKTPSTMDPQELMRREVVMKEIEGFSSDNLQKTDPVVESYLPTKEDIKNELHEMETDIKDSKEKYSGVMSEVKDFESSKLKPVDTEESLYLPDKIDLTVEKGMQGVMEEVKEGSSRLSHIEHTKEPVGPDVLMAEEINRTNTLDSLVHFDKTNLKHSEIEEKTVLPSVEDIESEKMRNNLTHDLEFFEKSSLNSTTVHEKNILPDSKDIESEKQHVELLSGIESFPREELKPSEVKEPLSPVVLAKQELTRDSVLHDVESYDKSALSHSTVEEKNVLPSVSDIVEERQHIELLTGIESFDPHALKNSSVKEPISPMDLAKQEFAHSALLADVEAYDKDNLQHSTTDVKNILPSSSDILIEREQFPDEPLAFKPGKMELEEQLASFSNPQVVQSGKESGDAKSRHISGSSSGSLESNIKSISNALSNPLSAPQTLDEQATSSSSDEWVKLDKQTGGDFLG